MSAIEQTISEHVVPPMSLEQQRDLLVMRLEAGFSKIEEASAAGRNVERWEDAWQKLLTEYESICDRISARH
jgi:hypothetical protein